MGKKLLEEFKTEIDSFKTEKIKNFVIQLLEKCSDMNAVKPASSTGKYHPISDLGDRGLIRHSKMVAKLTEIMVRSIPQYDNDLDHDIIMAAALVHDMGKFDEEFGEHSLNAHPIYLSAKIREMNKDNDKDIERIASIVETHMSRWNDISKRPWNGHTELPLPTSIEQYIVVFADLISANATLPEYMQELKEEAVKALVGR